MEKPRAKLQTVEEQVSEMMELCDDSSSDHLLELLSLVCGITTIRIKLKQRAHDRLLLLYGLTFQHVLDHLRYSLDIVYTSQAAVESLGQIAELIVVRAVEAAQKDLKNGFCPNIRRKKISMGALQKQLKTAISTLKAWKQIPVTNDEPGVSSPSAGCVDGLENMEDLSALIHQTPIFQHEESADDIAGSEMSTKKQAQKAEEPSLSTAPTSRTTLFNSAIFKRLPTGNSGQKHYDAPAEVPMQYTLSQKKASKNGKPKKPVFTVDSSNDAVLGEARVFSHSKFSETSLTGSLTLEVVTLAILWRRQSVHFTSRTKVEARVDIEATDLGQLVAFSVIMKDHAEQEKIDGGWPDEREEWQWEMKYPDVKTVVQYRRLG